MRGSALATAMTQFLMTTRLAEAVDLGLVIRAEFALTGFLLDRASCSGTGRRSRGPRPRWLGLDGRGGSIPDVADLVPVRWSSRPSSICPELLAVQSVPVPDLDATAGGGSTGA